MSLGDLTSSAAVNRAVQEFDTLGRDAFLQKYGFNRARRYFLVQGGQSYDSKAVPPLRQLALHEGYSRHEVQQILEPGGTNDRGAGTWGGSGIIEPTSGNFVFFVTFGKKQGAHEFDEGITSDGVLTWQSQPKQALTDDQIKGLTRHDAEKNSIWLFLRTRARLVGNAPMPYTYLGRLGYITHDRDREQPCHFQWQLLDALPADIDLLARIGLQFTPAAGQVVATAWPYVASNSAVALKETQAPTGRAKVGTSTPDFVARKVPDRAYVDARNRALGLHGERAVLAHERARLAAGGREDLAALVVHTSEASGDGAGYDIASFDLDGGTQYIEVKTTTGGSETAFYISANELEFSRRNAGSFALYRVYNFNAVEGSGSFYTRRGALDVDPALSLSPVQFRVHLAPGAVGAIAE